MLNKLYHYQKRWSEYIMIEVNKFLERKVMNEYLSLFFTPQNSLYDNLWSKEGIKTTR